MPSRIVREGILTSPKINQLSSGAELFYRRLLSVVDDYGRYHAHPTLLRAATYPLKMDVVLDEHVAKWLVEVIKAGLVQTYSVDGQKCLVVLNFGQKPRSKSRFPAPCEQPASNLPADCAQTASNLRADCQQVASCSRSRSRIRSRLTTLSDSGESDGEGAGEDQPDSKPREARYSERFLAFWGFFPRKVGKGKAWATFKRLNAADQQAAVEQAEAYAQAFALAPEARRQFFKHPTTWLNARSWEDSHAEWSLIIEGK